MTVFGFRLAAPGRLPIKRPPVDRRNYPVCWISSKLRAPSRAKLALAAFALAAAGTPPCAGAEEVVEIEAGKEISLGFLENATVGKLGLEMKAKLDTGADTSSVHAHDVEIYKRAKKGSWVRFRLVGKGGRSVNYDQRIVRYARIKTKVGGSIRRPVIRMPVCIGGKWGRAEINLADRDVFEYDMLIGREFLAGRILVDSGKRFIARKDCGVYNED